MWDTFLHVMVIMFWYLGPFWGRPPSQQLDLEDGMFFKLLGLVPIRRYQMSHTPWHSHQLTAGQHKTYHKFNAM